VCANSSCIRPQMAPTEGHLLHLSGQLPAHIFRFHHKSAVAKARQSAA
jgi:hypothetical protein